MTENVIVIVGLGPAFQGFSCRLLFHVTTCTPDDVSHSRFPRAPPFVVLFLWFCGLKNSTCKSSEKKGRLWPLNQASVSEAVKYMVIVLQCCD